MGNLLGLPLATLADLAPPPPLWGFHHITGTSPSPSAAPLVVENIILCVAAAVPVLLALVQLFILLVTGSVERTVRVFRTPAMLSGVVNSLLWLFYCLIVQRSSYSWIDAVTSNGFMLVLNYSYLMIVYSHRRCLLKGIVLSTIVVPCIIFLFAAMRWKAILPENSQYLLGSLGLISLFITYVCQIGDIYGQRGKTHALEAIITAMNFTPSLVFNTAVCYVTWVYHQEEVFLCLSSSMNCICSLIGIFLLIEKVFKDHCSSRQGDDGDGPGAGLPVWKTTNLLALGDVRTDSNALLDSQTPSSVVCENSLIVGQVRTAPDSPAVNRGMSSSNFVTSAIEGMINLDDNHETTMSRSLTVSPSYAVTIGGVGSHSLAPTSTGHLVLGCAAVLDRIPDISEKLHWNEFESGGSKRAQHIPANKSAPQVGATGSGWCCVPKNIRLRRMCMRGQGIVA